MALLSGKYATRTELKVIVWPAPDKDGDGPVVWITRYDSEGRQVGRELARDKNNQEIHEYSPPNGFENRPGYDNTPNYVMIGSRGEIHRQPNGEAVCIRPGTALVFHPDGSIETLEDEYAQYMFVESHDTVETDEG